MKVIEILNNNNKTTPSLELIPPLKGSSLDSLFETIETLSVYNPSFINLTYHSGENTYIEGFDGTVTKKVFYKRPGTLAIASSIMRRFNIEVVPHIICAGFNKWETENELLDTHYMGIKNVMALRGDADKNHKQYIPQDGGYMYASSLVRHINNLNKGIYLDSEVPNPCKTDFCIGVAGYPEMHNESISKSFDMIALKRKVVEGADYIITQMFFDNSKFFEFVRLCREHEINVPIIPGLKPLTTLEQISKLPKTFSIQLPEKLTKTLSKCKTNDDVREVGIEWCINQSKELKNSDVPVIHYYTMGRAKNVQEVLKNVFSK